MKPFQQRGSTLVGIIIGLVIGLTLAVVVALVITKGTSPFVNKVKNDKASEASTGQISDPNKPMYGNASAAKEAAKEFAEPSASAAATPATAPTTPATAATPPGATPTPAPGKPEARPPEDKLDKLIDKTIAKNETPAEDKWVYFLQAGAFKEQSDAENTRAKLALLGVEASLSERTTDNGVLYRVRVGPYNQVEAMNKVRAKLIENGIDVSIVHNQR
jgi:cell division protein FtsN